MHLPSIIQIQDHQQKWFLLLGIAILISLIFIASISGIMNIGIGQFIDIILYKIGLIKSQTFTDNQAIVLWSYRLPRILMAVIIGAGLAASGAVLQGLFRNPLVEPGLIGVSSGSALFAVLYFSLAAVLPPVFASLNNYILPVFAFAGGLFVTVVIYMLSKANGHTNIAFLLLAGIAINALSNALIGLTLYFSDDDAIRNFTFWTLGNLSGANWEKIGLSCLLILLPSIFMIRFYKILNVLNMGETVAEQLGAKVERSKTILIVLCALVVGSSVAMAGVIGFIGLVIPHFVRLLTGNNQKFVLTGSMLVGAIALLIADTIGRTIIAPVEIPIGIITSIICTPFFIWLLFRVKKQLVV